MSNLSIVVISNNQEKLEKELLNSLKMQDYQDYEMIIIDNTKNEFKTASSANNEGVKRATGKYILFIHNDVVFKDKNSLSNIVQYFYLLDKKEYAILGFAGIQIGEKRIMSLETGKQHKIFTEKELNGVESCFSVDECGFIMCNDMISKYLFADLGQTWHFYAVEICLRLMKDGYKIGVIPVSAWHTSLGDANENYYVTMKKLVQMYRKTFPKIYTTCYSVTTKYPIAEIKLNIKIIKKYIKKFLNKS